MYNGINDTLVDTGGYNHRRMVWQMLWSRCSTMVGNAMIFFVSSAAVYMGEAKSISCWSTRRNNHIRDGSIVKFDGNTHTLVAVIIYYRYFSKLLPFFKWFKTAVWFVFQLGLTLPVCVIDVCVHSVAPLWKNNSDQSYSCPRH